MSKPCFRMATIGVAFMQQHEDTAASQFETIAAALTAILKCVGRPKFLDSLFHLWSGPTHSLILMEHMFFPEQEIQTNTALALPRENLPLTAVMSDDFQQFAPRIQPALNSLAGYIDWFHDKYDANLHHEMSSFMMIYRLNMVIFHCIPTILS